MRHNIRCRVMRECVAALIVENQRILLGQRSAERAFYPGVWDVFGGHLEPQESCEQALLRELDEELGITPTAWIQIEILPEPDPERHEEGRYIFFLVTAWNGTPTNSQSHEHTRIEWFSLDQAVWLDLAHPSYAHLFTQHLTNEADNECEALD
jgi:8-oxo-dGTP diphosphatase